MTAPIELSCADKIATLTLARPDQGNTIDPAMARALLQAAERCNDDDDIRCVVLTGRGKLFCGGGDVSAFAAAGADVSAFLEDLAKTLHAAVIRLMQMKKPLITLVNGPAAGAGMSLAMIGDFALAARSAHFAPAYTALGLSPDGGMSWLLPRVVGLRRAQEIILSNRRVQSDEAERIGLITRIVDGEQLLAAGREIATKLVAEPVAALGAARHLLLESYDSSLETQLDREMRSIAALGNSEEARRRVAAFVAHRNSKG
ncbi:2-(1,2-epoxy-1,2-dihydrophenyl)acetyl-CoA isomerase [Bradyrhizobium sp. CIR48]|uniref:enoyl-CoA hydratase/isomerase family protein n=1 Tax=Bradyrhizobium sp. CIR48 TaxID=2663840 RepID=UPI001605616F|nr:enoyl-CoA hydratase/isomerase family protein [Bradyrhizobium sp. CIR48]MBB4427546.1 2-(1,2-epoxy-1,2-dihydrophenyl)acetyl-CoA isomerase [Bradyrhizobium sp. CIR48]